MVLLSTNVVVFVYGVCVCVCFIRCCLCLFNAFFFAELSRVLQSPLPAQRRVVVYCNGSRNTDTALHSAAAAELFGPAVVLNRCREKIIIIKPHLSM